MREGRTVYLFALVFIAVAIIMGRIATSETSGENQTASSALNAGTGAIGEIIADVLWLQIDEYHHIWMFQGHEWTTATDYLPQIWLITRLNPDFPDAYIDGAYHLAVNLDRFQEGQRLLDRGIRNCPDNEKVYWERIQILWQSGHGTPAQIRSAAVDYLRLVAQKRGVIAEPWNEPNASMILSFSYRDNPDRRNSEVISRRYEERETFQRFARQAGLWSR